MKFIQMTAAALSFVMLFAVQAFAGSLNLDSNGLAIQGYDPVAYFTQSAAVKGSSDFMAKHEGATYHFASAENRDLFSANPAKYVPAYGGYCAYGVTQGAKVPVEPDKFAVVDGKLYLNYNAAVQSLWDKDRSGYISKADKAWPGLSGS